jgi:hypothetical protein
MPESEKLIGLFEESTKAADAIDALHEFGLRSDQVVVMTGVPYPERALGRQAEWLRLPQVVLAGAVGGLVFGLFLAVITPHLYRLDVGGHPTVSFAPAAVITFVFTMLATIVATFLGVLWEMDFPEFGSKYYHHQVTDGRLAVLVEASGGSATQVRELLEKHGADPVQPAEKVPL